jgi:hypothetical protein
MVIVGTNENLLGMNKYLVTTILKAHKEYQKETIWSALGGTCKNIIRTHGRNMSLQFSPYPKKINGVPQKKTSKKKTI